MEEGPDDEKPLVLGGKSSSSLPNPASKGPLSTTPASRMVVSVPNLAGTEVLTQRSSTPNCPTAWTVPLPEESNPITPKVVPALEMVSPGSSVECTDPLAEAPQTGPSNSVLLPHGVEPILGSFGSSASEGNTSQNPWDIPMNLTSIASSLNASFSGNPPAPFPIFNIPNPQERSKLQSEMMITCVKNNPALWDSTNQDFYDSKHCAILWDNIANVVALDVKKVKAKWSALKKTFKKDYIKYLNGVYSKSPNFEALSFLEEEMKLELQREEREASLAKKQLQRIRSENRIAGNGIPVLHSTKGANEEEDDDCVIIGTVERTPRAQHPILSNTLEAGKVCEKTSSFQQKSATTSQNGVEPRPVKLRPISELVNKPTLLERSDSPDVVCVEAQATPKTKQYRAELSDRPVIKFSPRSLAPTKSQIMAGEGQSTIRNQKTPLISTSYELAPTLPSSVINQCARKSTSRASAHISPKLNGAVYNNINVPEYESEPIIVKMAKAISKIGVPPVKGESKNQVKPVPTESIMRLPLVKGESKNEAKPSLAESIMRVSLAKAESKNQVKPGQAEKKAKTKSSDTKVAITISNPMNPRMDNIRPASPDEVHITQEVPGNSACKEPKLPHKPKKREPHKERDGTTVPKKPRLSNESNVNQLTVTPKSKKVRENLANEHFLLSLLYDVETMTNRQFRQFKKHSTALVSSILDSAEEK